MGPLIDKIATIIGGVSGINAVYKNSRLTISSTPCAVIEAVCEGEEWEKELGSGTLRLRMRVSVSVLDDVPGEEAQITTARNLVLSLARDCCREFADDPTLDSGCLSSQVERTDFSYEIIGGTDYAQARMLLDAIDQVNI